MNLMKCGSSVTMGKNMNGAYHKNRKEESEIVSIDFVSLFLVIIGIASRAFVLSYVPAFFIFYFDTGSC